MPRINNINELRKDLIEAYEMLKADPKRLNQVAELANTAGKVLNSVKIELEYAHLRKDKPTIAFLEYDKPNTKVST